jgi:hypothetical protein
VLFAGAQIPQFSSIEGEVRNAVTGAPIERAHVTVTLTNTDQQRYGTLTDAQGKFVVTGIPEGVYFVNADRVGFISSTNREGAIVTLKPGDKQTNMKLKLTPTGSVAGRVLDPDGQPMEGVSITAESGPQTLRTTITDDRGAYRLGGLPPTKIRIRAQTMALPLPPEIRTDGTAEIHYSPTYYPSALDAKSAMRVQVAPATEATGIEIRMVCTRMIHVSGRVIGIPPKASNTYIMVAPRGPGAQVKSDGFFEMWRIDPGKYTLTAMVNEEGGYGQYSSGPVALEVGEQDIENLQIPVVSVGDLKGQVVYEDETARGSQLPAGEPQNPQNPGPQRRPAPSRQLMLRAWDATGGFHAAKIQEDGSFTVNKVPPGTYRVSLTVPSAYVRSMTLGPTNFDGAKLELAGGVSDAPLLVHVASSNCTVTGVVRDEKGPVAGVYVMIAEESAANGAPRQTKSKDDGSYTMSNLAPGKYRLFVVDETETNWLSTVSLESFDEIAEKIEIHDGETVTRDLKQK